MISCIITAYKEPDTIKNAMDKMAIACVKENVDYEILVIAPDAETYSAAESYSGRNVRIIKDPGKGKPTALNMAFKEAKGDLLILTDGDVYINQYAIRELIKKTTEKENIGIVSGRPRSISPRKNLYGFWSHLLTDMAHETREKLNGNFVCSGYLYALRPGIIDKIPEDCLSDDAYISYKIIEKGYKIDYAPGAEVFVKYPDNFKDWMNQKKRSTGGYTQLTQEYNLKPIKEMRSFGQEAKGLLRVISYGRNIKELFWIKLLIGARIWMWLNIFWERKIMKKNFNKTWVRIDSTK